MSMVQAAGLGISGLFSGAQLGMNYLDMMESRRKQEQYGGILDDYFGRTEGYLGQGYEEGMAGLQGTYGAYGAAGRGMTQAEMGLTGRNYTALQNMLGTDRYASLAGWEGREADIGGGYDAMIGGIGGGYDRRTAGIGGRYGQRLGTAMGMMEGLGEQQRVDVRQAYSELGASQQAGLAARGMGGTTIGVGVEQANLREQGWEMNRLNDMLTRERMDVFGKMTGEGLLARERMTGEGLLAGERMMGERLLAGERVSGDTQAMQDYWLDRMTKTAAERGFAQQDVTMRGMGRDADIGFQQGMAELSMGQEYFGNMANMQLTYPQMWGNFMTQNPVQFMDFSPGINWGGQVTAYGATLEQQRAADKAQGNPALGTATDLALTGGMFTLGNWMSPGGWWGKGLNTMGGGGGGGGPYMPPSGH